MSERLEPACAAYEQMRLLGKGEPAQVRRHLEGCPRCQARAARLDRVSGAIAGVDASLDDLTRARIAAGIEARLKAPARPRSRAPWLALPIAAAAALALIPISASRRPPGAEAPPLRLLRPAEGEGVDRLEVPAGMRMRASLGAGAKVTLLGPADVQVSGADAGTIALRLSAGTLLGEYDHRAGGRLLIESPGATTEVVGTRFSIEVVGAGSRVAVFEGRVLVRPAVGSAVSVGAGERWSTEDGRVVAIEATPAASPAPTALPAPAASPMPAAPPSPPRSPAHAPVVRRAAPRPVALVEPASPAPARELPKEAPVDAAPGPVVTPPAQPAPPAPVVSAAVLYQQAEAAMASRDHRASRRHLEALVERFPADPLADTARYELAQRALGAGDRPTALRWLAAVQRAPLAESAGFLRCRLLAEQGDDRGARDCFERFRSAYPRSTRDPDALAALVQLAWRRDDCAEARLLANEYRRRHPGGAFAAAAARIEGSCAGR